MDKALPTLDPVEIAGAVADLTPVDWPALEAEVRDPIQRIALARLQLLDRIVRACADIVPPGSAAPGSDVDPTSWGPFTIHERIGRGTFGDVYRAHDRRLDRIVALKLLKPGRDGDASGEEAIHEGRLLAKVRHPNVVTVYGAERIDGRVGVWMEFIDGRTLEDELRASGPLPAAKVIEVGLTLCDALEAVHAAGLLHRDLKAQNVMRAADGRLLLTDFGAGRVQDAANVDGGEELAGTPLYLAPEVLNGAPASVSSEVYGLGVLLYHLATGSFPVRGRTLRRLREAHAKGEHVSIRAHRNKISNALAAAIDRATSPAPGARYGSVSAFRSTLQGTRSWRRPLLTAAAVTVATGTLGVAALNVWWARTPPLRIVSSSVVLEDAEGIYLRFAKGDRLYYYYKGHRQLWSLVPGSLGSEQFEIDTGAFEVRDANAAGEYVATKESETGVSELWIVPRSGQTQRVPGVTCDDAVWAPDGERITCIAMNDAISIVTRDGAVSPLATPSQWIGPVRWSPAGDVVRFARNISKGDRLAYDIWEARSDGTGLRQLLLGWRTPPRKSIGPFVLGGRYFTFGLIEDERQDLWALREPHGVFDWTSREPQRLTAGPEAFSQYVASPDSTTIYAVGETKQGQLVSYDENAGSFRPYLEGESVFGLTFSPNRQSVAYTGYPDERVWRADVKDGRLVGRRPLMQTPIQLKSAAWSPDNRWIAFLGMLDGEYFRIFLMPPDGSALPQAISRVDRSQGIPSWSSDGRRFCYGDVPKNWGVPEGTERLHIYAPATKEMSNVPGSAGLWTCRWSPDGQYLAALTIANPRMMISVYTQATGVWQSLPATKEVVELEWSRDSQFIYYWAEMSLRKVRVSNGAVTILTDLTNYPVTQWVGVSPEGAPLLLHGTGAKRLYALKLGAR